MHQGDGKYSSGEIVNKPASYRCYSNIPFPSTNFWSGLALTEDFFPAVHGFHPPATLC